MFAEELLHPQVGEFGKLQRSEVRRAAHHENLRTRNPSCRRLRNRSRRHRIPLADQYQGRNLKRCKHLLRVLDPQRGEVLQVRLELHMHEVRNDIRKRFVVDRWTHQTDAPDPRNEFRGAGCAVDDSADGASEVAEGFPKTAAGFGDGRGSAVFGAEGAVDENDVGRLHSTVSQCAEHHVHADAPGDDDGPVDGFGAQDRLEILGVRLERVHARGDGDGLGAV